MSLTSVHFSLIPSPAALFKVMLCLPWTPLRAPNLILQLPGLFLFYFISRLQPGCGSTKANFYCITFWMKNLPWLFSLRSWLFNLYSNIQQHVLCASLSNFLSFPVLCCICQFSVSNFLSMLYTSSTFSSYLGWDSSSLVFCWTIVFFSSTPYCLKSLMSSIIFAKVERFPYQKIEEVLCQGSDLARTA